MVYSRKKSTTHDKRDQTGTNCDRHYFCGLGQSLGGVHVLPLVPENLRGGEAQVLVAHVAVIHSAESGRRGGARLAFLWLWRAKQTHLLAQTGAFIFRLTA